MSNARSKHFKTTIIIFICVALGLTFFSKTIYNRNLPLVKTIDAGKGRIVHQVESTAVLHDADTFHVFSNSSGKISDILFEINQEVKQGDTLLFLEPDKEEINSLQMNKRLKEQEIQLLKEEINFQNNGYLNQTIEESRMNIQNIEEEIEDIRQESNDIQQEIQEMESEIANIKSGGYSDYTTKTLDKTLIEIQKKVVDGEKLFEVGAISLEELTELKNKSSGTLAEKEKYLNEKILEIEEKIKVKQNEIKNKQSDAKNKQTQIRNHERVITGQELLDKEKLNDDSYKRLHLGFKLENAELELKNINEQLETAQNPIVVSDYEGIIREIHVEKGEYVDRNSVMFKIANATGEYKAEIPITEKQREFVNTNCIVEIKTPGAMSFMAGEVENLTNNSISVKLITDNQELDGTAVNVKVKNESEVYPVMLPNSAIRKDDKGYFLLVLKESNGILGKTYIAKRADITLLDSDESYSAIEGLVFMEPIINTSNKTLMAGMEVRHENPIKQEE